MAGQIGQVLSIVNEWRGEVAGITASGSTTAGTGPARRLSAGRHLAFSVYWFSIYYLWAALHTIILPYIILRVAGESMKGTALGLVIGVGLIAAVVVQPAAGAASDVFTSRWGRRRPFIVFGALATIVFLVVLGMAETYLWLFLSYLFLQVASNIAHGPYQGLIPDLVPEDERGRASGYMGAAQVIGMAAGAFISGHLVHAGNVGLALAVIGVAILAGMLVTVLFVPDTPNRAPEKRQPFAAIRHTFDRDLLNYPDFLWLLISRFFILLGLDSIRDFGQFFLHDVLALPNAAEASGILTTFVIGAGLLSVLPGGFLSDRFGRKRLVMASAAFGAVGVTLVLTRRSFEEILIYGSIVGIGMGVFRSVDWAFLTDLVPKSQAGRFLGISNIATAGAAAVSYLLGGPVIDIFNGMGPNLGYKALLVLVVGYLAVGTLAVLKVREVVAVDDPVSRAASARHPVEAAANRE